MKDKDNKTPKRVQASNMAKQVLKVRHLPEYQTVYRQILKEEFGIEDKPNSYEKYL